MPDMFSVVAIALHSTDFMDICCLISCACVLLFCYRSGSIAVQFLIVEMDKVLLLVLWGFTKLADAPVILFWSLKKLELEQVYQELSC